MKEEEVDLDKYFEERVTAILDQFLLMRATNESIANEYRRAHNPYGRAYHIGLARGYDEATALLLAKDEDTVP